MAELLPNPLPGNPAPTHPTERFKQITTYMGDVFQEKNADYGDSARRTYEAYGMTAYLVRMEDKLNRVKSLTKTGTPRVGDEKITDTLLDLANYCILAVMDIEQDNNRRKKCENS